MQLPKQSITNKPYPKTNIDEVGLLHVIEHGFRISTFKDTLLRHSIVAGAEESSILVIDILSVWRSHLLRLEEDENFSKVGVFYMNSTAILTMENLINFLLKLNESPAEALMRCQLQGNYSQQLAGIVIDNISYFTHDASTVQNSSSYNVFLKVLKMLRKTFGCWIITVSYGIEYYDGVENTTKHLNRAGSLTRLPISYTSEMDAILIRDTESSARFCSP